MRISHYFEWENQITGGQKQSVKNQRKILERKNIEYTTEPNLEADILVLNNMGPKSVYYARKARKKDVPVIIHTHQTSKDLKNSFLFSNILARPLKPYLKYAYSLADLLICPSEYNRREIENYTNAEKSVVSNGVDTEKLEGYEKLRKEYFEKYGLEKPVIFNVGHVIKRKGLETFVKTAEEMPQHDFVWFGFLNPLGEGSSSILQGRETKKIVENSPENCIFTGYIDDIRGAYAAGDIFFFPTLNENEGMALLESMSVGKPVVVRDIETYEWLEHGKNSLKAKKDFTPLLEKLVEDKELRESLGKSAEKKSKEFQLDKIGDNLVEEYRSVL